MQQNAYNTAQANSKKEYPYVDVDSSFELGRFYSAWAAIENTFNCTGFCKTNYVNSNNQNVTMVKYLFTNVNRYYINLL